jgi:hypothetical protein
MLALAVHARVPVDRLRMMIFTKPTFQRGVLDALAALSTGFWFQAFAAMMNAAENTLYMWSDTCPPL